MQKFNLNDLEKAAEWAEREYGIEAEPLKQKPMPFDQIIMYVALVNRIAYEDQGEKQNRLF